MVLQTIYALALAARALMPDGVLDHHWNDLEAGAPARAGHVSYEPDRREVSNWRLEAIGFLEPKPAIMLAAGLNAERPLITRCVKLNNYWCIKSARWNGELATDGEGHVGFISADHGADAAATLLRRYYLDYERKSALDIVRRWAPAECNVATGLGGMAVLAVKGIGGTVRARYLASRRKGGAVRYTAKARPGGKPGRVSMVIPMSPKTPQYRVPSIASGMGERAKAPAVRSNPVREPKATAAIPKPAPVATACAPDEQRLRNYAGRMVAGLNLGITDDLKLFEPDGTPLPNLSHVMLAMSAFELGTLRASSDLVERAVRRAVAKVEAKAMEGGGQPVLQRHEP